MLGGSVLWFRHGLRLHDNPALHAALQDTSGPFFPIFILDGETAGTKLVGYNRMRYLLEALNDLDSQLRAAGGRLYIIQGKPVAVIRRLWEEFGIRRLSFEQDCEPVWQPRDDAVKKVCRDTGIVCGEFVSHTLWDPAHVIRANGGIPPLTYEMFLHTVSTIGTPPRPVPDCDFGKVKFGTLPPCFYKEFTIFDKAPKPEQVGVVAECDDIRMIRWHGGESTALQQMRSRLEIERETFSRGSYMPSHTNPDLLGPPISLSPALRFGCLSVRKFYWAMHDLFNEVHQGKLPSSNFITGQLIWREYFYTMSVNNPKYGQMNGNPICLDIPWRDPEPGEIERWISGKTGFPFVDAAMRQLRTEGWLHHVVRNTVASFLTRGTLWLSWEHGLQHFLKYLLDADWSVCAGNWMWVSSSAFEVLLDSSECACPVRLGRRLDPSGEYVRRYVPELANMPIDYMDIGSFCVFYRLYHGECSKELHDAIPPSPFYHRSTRNSYEPWKASVEVQERVGCVIGRDYPSRMVDQKAASDNNRRSMQELKRLLEKAPPHCCPSSEDEIRQFMWLQVEE